MGVGGMPNIEAKVRVRFLMLAALLKRQEQAKPNKKKGKRRGGYVLLPLSPNQRPYMFVTFQRRAGPTF
jgi:hypothetical protein